MANDDQARASARRWRRDVEWAVASPFLMESGLVVEDFVVAEGDRFWQELAAPYAGHRVGAYFERLIDYWLRNVRGVEMLAQGWQIVEETKTLGELDFVFRDEDGEVNHWEVAAKFYLFSAEYEVDGSHYIGPNASDTFERKRAKIFDQQLRLSERYFPEVTRRSAFVKGRVYYPRQGESSKHVPLGLAADHLRGSWVRCSQMELLEADGTRFQLAQKPYWFGREEVSAGESAPMSWAAVKAALDVHFAQSVRPALISAMVQDGAGWTESERIFVVGERWPLD